MELKAVELSFLAEALPNDEVAVLSEGRGNSELCSVIRVSDNKELCRARFDWRPTPEEGRDPGSFFRSGWPHQSSFAG
jgi:hypothetical protein